MMKNVSLEGEKSYFCLKLKRMKKILGLMAFLLIMGCDDGDMTFQTFDFSDATASSCESGIIYKVNGSEVLMLNLAETNFVNSETPDDDPRIVNINSTNGMIYRKYNGPVTNANALLCQNPGASTPVIAEEWIANGGTIEISTNENTDDHDDDPLTPNIVTGYTHTIFLRSISFSRGDETIIITDNEFGDYVTSLPYSFNFNGTNVAVDICDEDPERLFITNQDEALIMNLDTAELFPNATTDGTPRTKVLDTDNTFTLEIYTTASIQDAHICDPLNAPIEPQRIGRWRARAGGTISVTTTQTGDEYTHIITLVDVTFENEQNVTETFRRQNYVLAPYLVIL
jgi:hypothetical protein